MVLPSREEVRRQLVGLARGESEPDAVECWADKAIAVAEADDPSRPAWDDVVWDALVVLSGAALEIAPAVRLHGLLDYAAWLRDFDEGAARGPSRSGPARR
ncbi:hypothetical protein ACFT5B_17895 [Luteimicrobium sp. NPDC057192]|uniref:hypothetical protein n=1 Tax=Luteimicrobium sp. NPDC057192 TaxID=3346042 RepID=UPI003634AB42